MCVMEHQSTCACARLHGCSPDEQQHQMSGHQGVRLALIVADEREGRVHQLRRRRMQLTTQHKMPRRWRRFRVRCRKATAKMAANSISAPRIIWYTLQAEHEPQQEGVTGSEVKENPGFGEQSELHSAGLVHCLHMVERAVHGAE